MIRISLWCRCGGGLRGSSAPPAVILGIAEHFRRIHSEEGCEVTEDPKIGARWRAAARRRERAA